MPDLPGKNQTKKPEEIQAIQGNIDLVNVKLLEMINKNICALLSEVRLITDRLSEKDKNAGSNE